MKAIYLPPFFSGFRDFLNHPSRLAASGANLFFYREIMLHGFSPTHLVQGLSMTISLDSSSTSY